jgi:hypothetical protein
LRASYGAGKGKGRKTTESKLRQLKSQHMGTNLRKDFNRTNNLELRNSNTKPLKSRSLENSDRKSSVNGMPFSWHNS